MMVSSPGCVHARKLSYESVALYSAALALVPPSTDLAPKGIIVFLNMAKSIVADIVGHTSSRIEHATSNIFLAAVFLALLV